MSQQKESCVKPAGGPVGPAAVQKESEAISQTMKEAIKMQARVGKPAPDFEANAYVKGSFKNVKLSDYKGKWIVVCFYPGDFTFV